MGAPHAAIAAGTLPPAPSMPRSTSFTATSATWLRSVVDRGVWCPGRVLQVPVSDFRPREVSPPNDPTLEATEREAILRTLRETNGVLGGPRGAAERLGLKRTTLQSRMRKLGIRHSR
jgi:transcriptional regulator with GAF, ATPase, and Fis domain